MSIRIRDVHRFAAGIGLGLSLFVSTVACVKQKTPASVVKEVSPMGYTQTRWLMDWAEEGRKTWYLTPQGSILAPTDIFLALRTEDGQALFSARENMEKYGWIYPPESDSGRYTNKGLPLGFSEEADEDAKGIPSIGFTCAACHTGHLIHDNVRYIIDGGQTMANVEKFNHDLTTVMDQALNTPARYELLVKDIAKINPASPYVSDGQRLKTDLTKTATYLLGRQERNTPKVAYGNGRIDAFSEILNEVLVDQANLKERDAQGKYINSEAPASPISLPAIWTAPQLDCVQTNCISRNPLTRNLGETLGVFGRARLRAFKHKIPGIDDFANIPRLFTTTADLTNLYKLEESLDKMPAPKWPEEILGKLDQELIKKGEVIYSKLSYKINGELQSCASCHVIADRSKPESLTEVNALGGRFFKVTRWDPEVVGTDTNFLDQHLSRNAEGLPLSLAALYDAIANKDKKLIERFDPSGEKSAIKFLAVTTNVAVKRFFLEKGMNEAEQAQYVQLHENSTTFRPRVYKARPLNGIAFTAPYLHNGSVPTLTELLSPVSQRSAKFDLGTLSWDNTAIGYKSTPDTLFTLGRFTFDTTIKGNYNTGHEWGSELASDDKRALLEYLKSL